MKHEENCSCEECLKKQADVDERLRDDGRRASQSGSVADSAALAEKVIEYLHTQNWCYESLDNAVREGFASALPSGANNSASPKLPLLDDWYSVVAGKDYQSAEEMVDELYEWLQRQLRA